MQVDAGAELDRRQDRASATLASEEAGNAVFECTWTPFEAGIVCEPFARIVVALLGEQSQPLPDCINNLRISCIGLQNAHGPLDTAEQEFDRPV